MNPPYGSIIFTIGALRSRIGVPFFGFFKGSGYATVVSKDQASEIFTCTGPGALFAKGP